MTPATILISLGLGMAFGLILQRVQASSPDRIIATLMLRDLTILKFMVLSVGVGAVGIGVLTALGLAHLKIKALALLGVGLGGIVFGVGFAVGGYCPARLRQADACFGLGAGPGARGRPLRGPDIAVSLILPDRLAPRLREEPRGSPLPPAVMIR